jgi:ribosomal protein S18 acetylase RimI-like enzyme
MTSLRVPCEDDVPLVVGLVNRTWPEPVSEDVVRLEWTAPGVDLTLDARIDGDGYALVESLHEGRAWLGLYGQPSEPMLDWAERRASEMATRLFAGSWADNGALLDALERRGFALTRHSHRMEIELDPPPERPTWPNGVGVRSLQPGDERVFYELHQETFEDSWEPIRESYEEWVHWLLDGPAFVPGLWFLALDADTPVGFAICHPHETRSGVGWVRILGVRRDCRRKGIGRALLVHAFAAFRERGFPVAGLGVDAASVTGANRLYEAVGMHVSARFDIYEKVVA